MLTIMHLITGLEIGGAERMLAQLARRADRRRFRSVVVSMTGPGKIGPQLEAAGIAVRSLDLRRGVPDPRGVLRLVRLLRAIRPDVLQTWLYHADLLGLLVKRLGQPGRLVWNLRCTDMADTAGLCRVLAWGSAVPDAVIVNSRAGQRYHEALGYRPRRSVLIPNGFDTGALRPDAEARKRGRAALRIPQDAFAVLLPARYHPMKDHGNFLAAAARLAGAHRNVHFALAGSGIVAANRGLADVVASHGLGERITLLGERRDLDTLYPAFDIVTLSSAFGEGFPNVLGEAMACAVPCVATDVGDAAAIIADCGVVVPSRDPEALAAGWESLIALGEEERAALGARARARIVEHYDVARMVARFEDLYAEIAAADAPSRYRWAWPRPADRGQRRR
jgi:glycosyltransferase involved in cell wall biosynthesis